MDKLKVGVLEDNTTLLHALVKELRETNLVEVVFYASNSTDFLNEFRVNEVDALLLDIDLSGDAMSGVDIADQCKKPVLFVSGKTKDFIHQIEDINLNSEAPVEHVSKPIVTSKLMKILPKFISEVSNWKKKGVVYLNLSGTKNVKIQIDSIVYIETETGASGSSHNKKIHFTDRKSEILYNFTLDNIDEKGLDKTKFIKISSSCRVNVDKIISYNNATHKISVWTFENRLIPVELKVSENFQKVVKGMFKM